MSAVDFMLPTDILRRQESDAPVAPAKKKHPFTDHLMETFHVVSPAVFFQNDDNFQELAGTALRKAAIHHLATSQGVVAKGFRSEYMASASGFDVAARTYKDFLDTQRKEGVWGTYVEAAALGELNKCHVVVIPVKHGREQDPICLYRAQDDNAPTVILHNHDNVHWQFSNRNNHGRGNCLYYAFGQALQAQVRHELRYDYREERPALLLEKQGMFSVSAAVVESQVAISNAISKALTPSQLSANLDAEDKRFQALSPEMKKQYISDHQLALKLAHEEEIPQKTATARIYPSRTAG